MILLLRLWADGRLRTLMMCTHRCSSLLISLVSRLEKWLWTNNKPVCGQVSLLVRFAFLELFDAYVFVKLRANLQCNIFIVALEVCHERAPVTCLILIKLVVSEIAQMAAVPLVVLLSVQSLIKSVKEVDRQVIDLLLKVFAEQAVRISELRGGTIRVFVRRQIKRHDGGLELLVQHWLPVNAFEEGMLLDLWSALVSAQTLTWQLMRESEDQIAEVARKVAFKGQIFETDLICQLL